MRLPQFILLAVGVFLVLLLFLFAKQHQSLTSEHEANVEEQAPPMMNQPSAPAKVDFDFILQKAKGTLSARQSDSVANFETQLRGAKNKLDSLAKLNVLANVWLMTGNTLVAGKYFLESSSISHDRSVLEQAAQLFYEGFPTTSDTVARIFGAQQGIEAFKRLVALDTANNDYQIREASCYMYGLGDVMNGVMLLKQVERRDSNNEDMNLILGRFGVLSGQYDKAIPRLEKVVKLNPTLVDAYVYLAEAYGATGKKEQAINSLERCKAVSKDPQVINQLNQYINQIKNQ